MRGRARRFINLLHQDQQLLAGAIVHVEVMAYPAFLAAAVFMARQSICQKCIGNA